VGNEGFFSASGRIVNRPYREAFDALKKDLMGDGYTVTRADENAGIISVGYRPISHNHYGYCDCRSMKGFQELGRKVRMTFVVTELGPTRTEVTVRTRFTAYWSDGSRTVERGCASSGRLEKDILRF
jgi:hypothetical protein